MVFGAIGLNLIISNLPMELLPLLLWSLCFMVVLVPTGEWRNRWQKRLLYLVLCVVVTALITGLFCHYVLGVELIEGMLIGSIVGSTDYASVSISYVQKLKFKI